MENVYRSFNYREIPLCPIYRPSEAEFENPLSYVRSIDRVASEYGICKIIPPKSWGQTDPKRILENRKTFKTKLQYIHRLQDGYGHDDGRRYSPLKYKKMADRFATEYEPEIKTNEGCQESRLERIEKYYWRIVEHKNPCEVEYGSDLSSYSFGSGFDAKCTSEWNLNLLPSASNSLLKYLRGRVSGVNEPWLYFGMLFSTFCWHYEDDCLFSISYNHTGSAKLWYGVPGQQSNLVEAAMRQIVPDVFEKEPDIMMKLVTMVSPLRLMEMGVSIRKSIHLPGEFMITFPGAFHGGFNTGFNVAEAVNFAIESWLPAGLKCAEKYSQYSRESVISHERIVVRSAEEKRFSKEDAIFVIDALQTLVRREKTLRRQLDAVPVVAIRKRDRQQSKSELEVQCEFCKRKCFLSFIGCRRHRTRFGCLSHYSEFCSCGKRSLPSPKMASKRKPHPKKKSVDTFEKANFTIAKAVKTLFLQLPYSVSYLESLITDLSYKYNML